MAAPPSLLAELLKWHNMDRGGSLLYLGAESPSCLGLLPSYMSYIQRSCGALLFTAALITTSKRTYNVIWQPAVLIHTGTEVLPGI